MKDELDYIVSGEEEIVPTSGFVASVMEAIQQEAEAPRPIAFPWGRAVPGLVALGAVFAMLVAAVVEGMRMPAEAWRTSSATLASWQRIFLQPDMGWIALTLLLTIFSVFFSIRLTRGQG